MKTTQNRLKSLLKIPLFALLFLGITSFGSATPERSLFGLPFIFDEIDGKTATFPDELKNPSTANDLKVFWWNIRDGAYWSHQLQDQAKKAGDPNAKSPLDENLKTLALSSNPPEVILLGEFELSCLEKDTDDLFAKLYPYQLYVPDSKDHLGIGIQIYSAYPFETASELLDWSPYYATTEKQEAFKKEWAEKVKDGGERFYDRSFSDLKIKKGDKLWHVLPVHLLNNWSPLAAQIGKEGAGITLLFGTNNPHYRQVERLVDEKIAPILDSNSKNVNLLLIGDFNLPDELFGIMPVAYRLLSNHLQSAFQTYGTPFTFPAVNTDMSSVRRMTIDHAFTSEAVETLSRAVIPLTGSDHYPIEVHLHEND